MYSYETYPSRFGLWQEIVTSSHMDADGPDGAAAMCGTTRRIGFAERPVTSAITDIDRARTWTLRGIDGPIRA